MQQSMKPLVPQSYAGTPGTTSKESTQQRSLPQLFKQFHTSEKGLTTQEARQRLSQKGPNVLSTVQRRAGFQQLLLLLSNPLVIILLAASIVTAVLGDVLDASIIIVIVLLSITLNFLQTHRSQRAADRLREKVALTATALRDGNWGEIPRRELVPGDIIRLSAGDLVPADARLLHSVYLHVQQSALTGESLPVEKDALETDPTPTGNLADTSHTVFLGTSVVSGTGTALVTATGRNTAFGDIVAQLARRPPETEFERGVKHFGLLITRTVFFLVLFVFLVGIIGHHSTLESALFAISLAVGLTPEFLPMIVTITLSQGASRMAKEKVIVKHLESMQNFGSIDVLCSDKTGTLTTGEMAFSDVIDAQGNTSNRARLFAYLNSSYQTGTANAVDTAILRADHQDLSAYHKRGEIPFDFERRRLSVIVESNDTALLISKGAPESILHACTSYEADGQDHALDSEALARCQATHQQISGQGYYTVAVSYRPLPLQQEDYSPADEQAMIFLGFLTFFDPPREDAAQVLAALRRDGITVKILTGDNALVTRHICAQVGLNTERMLLGDELDRLDDLALAHVVEQVDIFARVSPAQKNRVILALKSRHHVVGFLGDGINDAPSLHAADVGISVASGVDVAKEAAELILLERGLDVLHKGIIEGRKAFGNVMKYLLMGSSSNFGNMFSMAFAFVFLPFLPMLPSQILLNNFLYDLSQVTIPTDNVDATFIQKPQRWNIKLIRDFMIFIGPISSIFDFLTFLVMLAVFHAAEPMFHTGWFVESLATQTLVLFVIRTSGNPFRSRPSLPLTISVLTIVAVGLILPYTPLAAPLKFTPLPGLYFLFLAGATSAYLLLVEVMKRILMRRWLGTQ
ncbi:MAG TPA: magnesium-translocating P-type ATPase [Ktedonobacteraceae bacterium]|nr:magnesium-translocating P-type ATPase [Ktedonobacteraceae bacterium]